MIDGSSFRALASGRHRGVGATIARGMLRAAEVPYTAAVGWRNHRYDAGHATVHRVAVPVVCVGNLTLGGTGKTPFVKWLASWSLQRGIRVAIVSRGYGAASGERNDEARELQEALPSVPHVQNSDRVEGARTAIDDHQAQLILLDDGFQHRRLGRDLDIVLVDATEPFGFEHVFPRGTLREPLSGLRRAGVVCLSRADSVDESVKASIRQRVAELAPAARWCEAAHIPCELLYADGRRDPVSALDGRRVAAFCAIGNPAAFGRTLAALKCDVVWWREFPDHHQFTERELRELAISVAATDAEQVVVTHKDFVKLPRQTVADRPLAALTIDLAIAVGRECLEQSLENLVPASATS
jgi:tetraacyldisaccharide 4'-kinase